MRKTMLSFAALCLAVSIAVLNLTTPPAASAEWPTRPVHVLVPFAAGTDTAVRLFAKKLSMRWNQPVVVENRPGAEGMIAVEAFLRTHDDHTLLWDSAAPISTFPLLREKLAYDPTHDLVPISSTVDALIVVIAPETLNVRSLHELVALARTQPGKLNYLPFNGGSFSILMEGFVKKQGLDMVEVNYRDIGLASQDLITGRIHVMMTTLTSQLSSVQSGKVRLLAVTNDNRVPIAPDVQTAVQAGFPELAFNGLQGLFGTTDMPAERRERIATDLRAVAVDPSIAGILAPIGISPHAGTTDEFAEGIERQRSQMVSLAKLIGLKPTR
jgi:tripartite-type tricarboxylate transporter receptor subunit TctC